MIHNTKDNIAICDFDERFPQMPSYIRRDVQTQALGNVASYISNKANYEEQRYYAISNGQTFKIKPPVLGTECNKMPTFYKNNAYIPFEENNNIVELKLIVNNQWKYVKIALQNRDLKYIKSLNGKLKNPVLTFEYGRFHLKYAIETEDERLKLLENTKANILNRKIMSVDLGINNDAVCTIMYGSGTIVAREFISFTSEKAELYTLINRKKRKQRESGSYKFAPQRKLDTKIKGVNDNLTNQIKSKLIKLAVFYQVDVVVFEHLSQFKNKKKGIKIHFWRKKKIIKDVCAKLHHYGIHYSTINPKNTSNLAFDGSGKVTRSKSNFSLCIFSTGKRYHCDLSASLNIGGRYFIREFLNLFPNLESIVPSSTLRTYSDLLTLNTVLV